MGVLLSFILIIGLQLLLRYILALFGLSGIVGEIIFNLVLALVFTLILFRGQEKLRNPNFHKMFAMYFIILMLISLLFMFI